MLVEWTAIAVKFSDLDGPLSLIANVALGKGTRDAAHACELELTPFQTGLLRASRCIAASVI